MLNIIETEETLIAEYRSEKFGVRKKPAVAVIGPAAEKLSLILGISNDLGLFAARSGVSTVRIRKN